MQKKNKRKNEIFKSPPKISNWGVGDDGEGEICTVEIDVMWCDVMGWDGME